MVTDNEYVRHQIKLELQNILAEELPALHTYAEAAARVIEDDLVTADAIQAVLGVLANRASRLSQTAEEMMCDACQYIQDPGDAFPEESLAEDDPEDLGKPAWIKHTYQTALKIACSKYFDSLADTMEFIEPIASERVSYWLNEWPGDEDPYTAENKNMRERIKRAARKDGCIFSEGLKGQEREALIRRVIREDREKRRK